MSERVWRRGSVSGLSMRGAGWKGVTSYQHSLAAWLEKPGGVDREGPYPPGPINYISWVGPRGTQYITKMGPFTSFGLFFSNCRSCRYRWFWALWNTWGPFSPGPPRPCPLHLWIHLSSPDWRIQGGNPAIPPSPGRGIMSFGPPQISQKAFLSKVNLGPSQRIVG